MQFSAPHLAVLSVSLSDPSLCVKSSRLGVCRFPFLIFHPLFCRRSGLSEQILMHLDALHPLVFSVSLPDLSLRAKSSRLGPIGLLFRNLTHLFAADRPNMDTIPFIFMRCISLCCPFRRPIRPSFPNRASRSHLGVSRFAFSLFHPFFCTDSLAHNAVSCNSMRCISLCFPFPRPTSPSLSNLASSVFALLLFRF